MTIVVKGARKIRDLQRALGGAPPRAALEKSRAELTRYLVERFKARQRARKQAASLGQPLRELAFRHIPKNDPKLETATRAARTIYQRGIRSRLKPPQLQAFEPSAGSGLLVDTPPYNASMTSVSGSSSVTDTATADANAGTFSIKIGVFGDGPVEASAGLGVWFFAPADAIQQPVAAILNYSDSWYDSANLVGASASLATSIWVWGATEQRWVVQTDVSPAWNDSVGWFDTHGNYFQGGESAGIAVGTFFPAFGGNWYQAWVQSTARVDADSFFTSSSSAIVQFSASLPFVTFGSLSWP